MKIFDRVDPGSIERRELHLWILALTVIFVLAVGQALIVYPAAFEKSVILNGPELRNLFFAFCALSVLMLGYFVDRQIVIRQLRRRLTRENHRVERLRQQASLDMLGALPGLDRFKDALAMEFRRAFNARQPLSLLTVAVRPCSKLGEVSGTVVAYGDALKTLARKLRREDSLYSFGPGFFGIVLPGVGAPVMQSIAHRLADGLSDASGVNQRFEFDLEAINYPADVKTAREMEEKVRSLLPEDLAAAVPNDIEPELNLAGN